MAEKGVEILGISVDRPYAHKAFQEKLGIDTPLLADFEPKGEVARPTAPTSTARLRQPHPRPRRRGRQRRLGLRIALAAASSPAPTSSSTPSTAWTGAVTLDQRRRSRRSGPEDHVRGEGRGAVVYADLGCPHCAAAWAELAARPRRSPSATSRSPASTRARRRCTRAAEAAGPGRLLRVRRLALRRPRPRRRPAPLGAGARRSGSIWSASRRDRRSEAVAARVRRDFESGIRGRRRRHPARSSTPSAPVRTLSAVKENESSESRWPPTGRPEVGQLNEHV